MNLGFLASHNGSNMQAVVDACNRGDLGARPAVVISNNSGSGALERARREGISAVHLSGTTHPGPGALDSAIVDALQAHEVDMVVLAGYMKKLGPRTLACFTGRILNIHPSLLPRFGGQGMYGRRVHEAVIEAGESVTGVTVHLVDEGYDTGRILAQAHVAVEADDNPDTLAARVLRIEHQLFASTLQRVVEGELELFGPER